MPFVVLFVFINLFVFIALGILLFNREATLYRNLRVSPWWRKQIALYTIFLSFYIGLMPVYGRIKFVSAQDYFANLLIHLGNAVFVVVLPIFFISSLQKFLENKILSDAQKKLIIVAGIFAAVIVPFVLVSNTRHGRPVLVLFLLSPICIAAIISFIYLILDRNKTKWRKAFQENQLEIARLNELKVKAEFEALQAKVNPHFLYNTLNSIAELSINQGSKAREMAIALANIFRYTLNDSGILSASVKEEIDIVNAYLRIEQIRFDDRLAVDMRIEDEVGECQIPRMVIQPLIENSIKHGFTTADDCHIELCAFREKNTLVITVFDNGRPFPEDMQMRYGLRSVIDKLNWLYPTKNTLTFQNTPRKMVTIAIDCL